MASSYSSEQPPSYIYATGQKGEQQELNETVNRNPYEGQLYQEVGGHVASNDIQRQQVYNVQPGGGVYVVVGPQIPGQVLNPEPSDYLKWSIFNVIFCNVCCFGWLALYFSIKSKSELKTANLYSANFYSNKARLLNRSLTVVGTVFFFIYSIHFLKLIL